MRPGSEAPAALPPDPQQPRRLSVIETVSPSPCHCCSFAFYWFFHVCLGLVCKFALVLPLYKNQSWKEFYIRPHVSNLTIKII